jgi:hypothetical protein
MVGWLASLGSGLLLWSWASLAAGRRELWDAGSYWSIYLPLAALIAGVLGFAFPDRPWRWALAVMMLQAPVVWLTGSGDLGLFPLTLVFVAVLAVPAIGVAYLGLAARRWVST